MAPPEIPHGEDPDRPPAEERLSRSSKEPSAKREPPYRKYRARRFVLRRRSTLTPAPGTRPPAPAARRPRQPAAPQAQQQQAAPSAPVHAPPARQQSRQRRAIPGARGARKVGGWTAKRIARRAFKLAFWWVVTSVVVFLVSAQLHQTSAGGGGLLGGAGFPLTSPNTILVLGSDARPKDSKEAGAQTAGSRSDSIMLLRVGGGASSKLSIPRDTLVPIPGHGLDKVNAAYAYGGADLSVKTLESWLGIEINHVIEVNFENFPKLIDAMGGVSYKGGCVVSKINGGFKNGGYTLRLKSGRTHIDGKQALALARTRKNLCNPRENDLARARRQQKLLSSMKWRMLTPMAFVRLPWIAWQAPQTMRSDMNGVSQIGMFGGLMIGGGGKTRVLQPDGAATSPGGGAALTVSPGRKQAAVERFMRG